MPSLHFAFIYDDNLFMLFRIQRYNIQTYRNRVTVLREAVSLLKKEEERGLYSMLKSASFWFKRV